MSITDSRQIKPGPVTIQAQSLKVALPFRHGSLPKIDPEAPRFTILLGGIPIVVAISAKAARKAAIHQGGAVLQGRLQVEGGRLVLREAGFSWLDPEPKTAD
jgi:hypothetical protein